MHSSSSFKSPSPERLTRFVHAIHASLDPLQIAQIALTFFQELFPSAALALYRSDPARRVLRLLAAYPETDAHAAQCAPLVFSYDESSLMARTFREHAPLLVTDLSDPGLVMAAPLETCFRDESTRGCICVPLWCGPSFEGCLLATFPTCLPITEGLAHLLRDCTLHLATALYTAHLHEAVEEEHTRQRAVLEQLPEGIVITEAVSGSISYANSVAAQILGMRLHDLIGSTLHVSTQASTPLSDPLWPRVPWTFAVIRALGGEAVNQLEAVVIRANGARIPVLCSATPLRGGQGQVTGAILVFQDITTQKNLEAQKNLFFSFASHELRTPLTAIMGYAEVLQQVTTGEYAGQLDLEMVHLASQHISVQTEQMAYLLDEMLDLSHLDQKQLALRLIPVDLLDIARHVMESLATTTHRHQLHLVLDRWDSKAAGTQVMVVADRVHLARILNNLIQNAIKYSPEGGNVEVGIERHPSSSTHALFWVKDHGLGIAQSDLPHLFTKFYRAPSLDSAISGLGIGLYLIKQLIELQAGQVWVESTEGQGSTFFLSLPLMSDPKSNGIAPPSAMQQKISRRGR